MALCISFTVPGPDADAKKFKALIQKEALRQGLSMSELIVEAVAEYLRGPYAQDKN